jgi:hypothetical protein
MLQTIEEIIQIDPGNRGLAKLFPVAKGELKKACEHLLDPRFILLFLPLLLSHFIIPFPRLILTPVAAPLAC